LHKMAETIFIPVGNSCYGRATSRTRSTSSSRSSLRSSRVGAAKTSCSHRKVHQLYTNRRERRRTIMNAFSGESLILQVILNNDEQLRHHESDFARRRSGVRIPSAPLQKCSDLQVKHEQRMSAAPPSQALEQQCGGEPAEVPASGCYGLCFLASKIHRITPEYARNFAPSGSRLATAGMSEN
jgi:hypothetical protein